MSRSLYAIAEDVQALDDIIEASMVDGEGNAREPTDEEKAAILDMIAETEEAFRAKAERICQFRQELVLDAAKFAIEEERIAKRRKTMERKADALKMYLYLAMEKIKQDKLQAGTFRLRFQKSPPTVTVVFQDLLDAEYIRTIPEIKEPDKGKIKGAFEVGAYPWGAITQGKHLRIE